MNDSIKGVVERKCPECGWERKVSSLTPPTATLFCKECDYQGASELWTTNAQADRLPEEQLWELVAERVYSINNASNQSTSLRSQRKNEKPTETRVKPSALRWLPSAFYVIAILGFAGFVILAIQSENSFLFGYGVGATIACFGSGRLIELVQDINDELYRKRMSE